MSEAPAAPAPLRRRVDLLVAAPILLALCLIGLMKPLGEWQGVYVLAAHDLTSGRDIYAPGRAYLYPPFAAVVAIPFTGLGDLAGRIAWRLIDVAAIVALARSAWRLSGGHRLDGSVRLDRAEWAILALGVIVAAPYGMNVLAHQQTDLVIAALVTGGCYVIWTDRRLVGAALIGLGAAFKGPPLLFAAYFLLRRRWLEAGVIAVVAVGVNLSPDLVARAPGGGLWLGHWLTTYVLPSQAVGAPLGEWGSDLIYNQSLGATLRRLAGASVDGRLLKAAAYGVLLAMLGATVWQAWRGGPPRRDLEASAPGRFALECGAVIALMLLASPMSGLAHFAVLALPALCVARLALGAGGVLARSAIGLAAVAALVIGKDLVGAAAYDLMLGLGVTTFSAMGLWAACVAGLARKPNRAH